jgi:thiol-disulfide isomerase/thioredoxin
MTELLLRVVVVATVLGAAALFGRWWNRRDGGVRVPGDPVDGLDAGELDAVGLDPRGVDAVALLLGSPTCAPCVTVKRVLTELAAARPGFRWSYVDAADHPQLVARHRVRRVPTLLLLDRHGRLLARTSGVPTRHDLAAVLDRTDDLEPAA